MLEMLERREMLAGDTVSAWHNPLIAGDVNFDQRVSASDLLVVVNDLLRNGSRSLANEEAVPLSATTGSPRPRYIDVNNDNRVSVADVMTVVNALLATNNMRVQTIVTDLAGNEITSISVGSQYLLKTFVTDIRNPPQSQTKFQGVFSAGADIVYNSALSSIDTAQTVQFGSFFSLIQEANLQQGRVVGYASTDSAQGPGNAPQFLFSVMLTAQAGGTQTFTPQLYTSNPDNEYNMYLIDPPFDTSTIEFVGDTLEIIDQPAFSLSGGGSASETNADHPSVFTVTLSQPAAGTTTVAYTTVDGSATVANNDYVPNSGTLTFNAGQTTALITVTVKGDQNIENDETFSVSLSNPSAGNILGATTTAVATIVNDDFQANVSILGSTVNNVAAGTTQGFFTVSLSHSLGAQATVQYATANNTALAGVDYQATSGTLTFAPGEVTKTVPVTIIGDPNPDDVDRFFVNLTNPSSNAIITTSQAEIVIQPAVVGVSVSITPSVSANEGNAGTNNPFVFTISLSSAATSNVVVAYATADDTATAGSDYIAKTATVTFTPGQTAQLITIQAIGDNVQEGNETFKVNMLAVSGGVGFATATGTIVDDDGPATLRVNDATVSAGTGLTTIFFTVTLSGLVTEPVTVGYSTDDGSAVAGVDYFAATGNLLFAVGETTKVVPVTILSSGSPQPDKTFFLNLSSAAPPGVVLADDQAVGTIVTQGLSISDASVVEGNAGSTRAMVFTVSLSRQSDLPVTVAYATQNGTALDSSDYAATSGTLTFAPNTSTQLVTVLVNGDDVAEGNENFKVILSNATNAPVFNAEGTGTIINDDGDSVSYQLELYDVNGNLIPQASTLDVNDEFYLRVYVTDVRPAGTATGVAQAYLDVQYPEGLLDVVGPAEFSSYWSSFTSSDFEPGLLNDFGGFAAFTPPADPSARQLLYQVRFKATDVGLLNFVGSANEGDLDDGHETLLYFSVDAAPVPSGQIVIDNRSINVGANVIAVSDATANESGQMVFTVTRFLPTAQTATVEFNTANGTAIAGQDYLSTSGTLTFAAGTTVQLVTVSLINDTIDEPNETFSLVLKNPTAASISAAAAIGTIIDDDGEPTVSVSGGSASEGQGVVFNVSLGQASGKTVTVVYATTGSGTATPGVDYSPVSGTLTFAPGTTVQSVTVPTLGDILLEANETFQLALSSPQNAVLGTSTAQGTIVDVPPAGISGYVYVDLNNNGLKDANETGIGGVIVTATNSLTGASQSVLTNADGSYTLVGLIPGTYTLTETQPGFYSDGRDTRFGVDSPLNDQWVGISLAPSQAATGYNFGEQGIRSDFLSAFLNRRALFATATIGGFGPNVNLPGTQLNLKTGDIWVSFDGGWSGLRQVEALFNSAQGNVTMRLYNNNLQEVAISAPSANGAVLLYNGQIGTTYFLKISGSNPSVTVQISTTPLNLTGTSQGSSSGSSSNSSSSGSSSSGSTSTGFNRFASAIPMTSPAADPLVADDDSSEAFAEEEDWLLDSLLA
jgi:hypothetical protein